MQSQSQSQGFDHTVSQHYATRLNSYDEMLAGENAIHPHWQQFIDSIEALGVNELESRRQEAQSLLRENGVTYTVYGDDNNINRSWQLDPIPVLLDAQEWKLIEQGLAQRAELLNLILKDLYGNQQLLTKGLLPAELIFAHQGFFAPCVNSLPDSEGLRIYAANLARGPNGRMWVLNDHCQAPSGIGYSLENRSVMMRVMSDLFQKTRVQRLGDFFSTLQKSLAQSAPHNKSDPHIVVLTPGPLNETYFEHAYLASQLGFTLAQGEDLTVRDGKVWLRTLEGLQRVDVILRRVDDSYCDPLELRGSSKLGVAGLLQAVRLGNVSVANTLGSSVLENAGLLAFLPGLCRYFLNQELLLPSVATWWCGGKKECDFVIKNISRLAIKSINRGGVNQVIFGNSLDKKTLEALISRIKAKPYLFVGQEQATFSTVPTLNQGQFEPHNSILRGFAVACDNSYHVMPGGLTRVAADKDQFTVSNQFGAVSKDTWVLSDEEDQDITAPVNLNRTLPDPVSEPLTSRAADNLFWVGRHFERIFSATRLLRTILIKQANLADNQDLTHQQCQLVLLHAVTQMTGTYPGFLSKTAQHKLERQQEILSLFKDQNRSGTIAGNIHAFFLTAFNIRDLWSQDTWRCIDTIHQSWQQSVSHLIYSPTIMSRILTELSTRLAAFSGLTSESITRETGWSLLQLGRKLERSLALISLLRATVVHQKSDMLLQPILEAILLTTDSFSIYQRRYRSAVNLPLLLELLLSDRSLPYSLLFQLQHLQASLTHLPGHQNKSRLCEEQRLLLKANSALQLCDFKELIGDGKSGVHENLDHLLAEIADFLWQYSDLIGQRYFIHTNTSQQLSPTRLEESL